MKSWKWISLVVALGSIVLVACGDDEPSSCEDEGGCDGGDVVRDGGPRVDGGVDAGGPGFCATNSDRDDDGDIAIACGGPDCDDGDPDVRSTATETCNGVDDDCDGTVDDGVSEMVFPDCDDDGWGSNDGRSGCEGAPLPEFFGCEDGATWVVARRLGTSGPTVADCNDGNDDVNPAAIEVTCNDVDDDCDADLDETLPTEECESGTPGACGAGHWTCVDDEEECVAGTPSSTEICNGIDDDCDGTVDDGIPDLGESCVVAGAEGACAAGETTCDGVSGVRCVGPTAGTETCNAIDDDCDGDVDNGIAGTGVACATGEPGACGAGTISCDGTTIDCRGPEPVAETCDGVDNDCDGAVDDSPAMVGDDCTTGMMGVCAAGTRACTGGDLVCTQDTAASAEICNGLDDNCDGDVDEDLTDCDP